MALILWIYNDYLVIYNGCLMRGLFITYQSFPLQLVEQNSQAVATFVFFHDFKQTTVGVLLKH